MTKTENLRDSHTGRSPSHSSEASQSDNGYRPTKSTIRTTAEQETAIAMCSDLGERIVGVTGGAGTGKTFVLGRSYHECKRLHPGVGIVLVAPTGRAAKRIQELTGIPAQTIHRLLKFPTPDDPVDMTKEGRPTDGDDAPIEIVNVPTDHLPRHTRNNPIFERVVFCDESSMLDPTLFRQLLDALPAKGCIRLFGDNNQLPPVDDTDKPPFVDIIRNKPSVTLTFNFRSDDEIVSNANLILRGSIPRKNDRFHIIYTHDPIRELVAISNDDFMRSDYQIIMPTRKGTWGTSRVNVSIQSKLNKGGPNIRIPRFEKTDAHLLVRQYDKFLWIKNDYNLKLFNGEIGIIDAVDAEDGSLELATMDANYHVPARIKTYSPYLRTNINYDPRKQLELGYAITTHKAQGSEFDTVIYCMTSRAPFMLNRNNFYTGVTRAKRKVILLCDPRGMSLSLRKRFIPD